MDTTCNITVIDNSDIVITKGYGGNAGRKLCYRIDGVDYMVKFPNSTRDIGDPDLRSYTTSPISEHVGSRIYESLGIAVHKTRLVECEGKIAVACKDFTSLGNFIPFSDIKNTIDETKITGSYGSSSRGERINDVLTVISNAPIFQDLEVEAKARFWKMFIVDAIILNNDRNNGNWGLLVDGEKISLAPVFDNGNAFFNKRTTSIFEKRIVDDALVDNDIDVSCSFFTNDSEHHIHPFDFMKFSDDEMLIEYMKEFVDSVNMSYVSEIINSIPEVFDNLSVIAPAQKRYYIKICERTIDRVKQALDSKNI